MSYPQHPNQHQKPPPPIRYDMQQNQPRSYATGPPSYQNQRPPNPQNIQRIQQHSQHPLQMVPQASNQQHVVRGMAPQQMSGSYIMGAGPGPNGTMVATYPPHLQPGMNIAIGQHQPYRFHQIPQPSFVYGTPQGNIGYSQQLIIHHQQQLAAAGANASYMNPATSYHHQNAPAQNAVPVQHQATQYYAAPMHHQQYIRAPPIQTVPQVQQVAQQQPQQPHQVHHQVHQQQQQQQQPMQQSVQVQGQHAQQAEHREHPQHQPPPQQYNSQPRQRKILKILDPTTGKPVIQDDGEPIVSVSPQPTVEQVGTNDVGFVSIEEVHSGPTVAASLNANVNVSPTPEEDPGKPVSTEETPPEPGEGVKKVKEEFFRLITRSADDNSDGRSSSNSTSESVPVPTPNVNIPVPSTSTEPVVESSSAPMTTLDSPIAPEPETPSVVPSTPQIVPPQGEVVIITPPKLMQPLETLTPSPNQTVSPASVEANDQLDQSLASEPDNTSYVDESHLSYENGTPQKMSNSANLSLVSGGGGDDLTEASLVSISPIPIEKYVQATPEKPSAPSATVESGEPTSVDTSTRESTLSPSFPTLSKEETPDPTPSVPSADLSSTPMEVERVKITPLIPKPISEDKPSEVNRITESLEQISIIPDQPAQTEETLVNGGAETRVRVGENYEDVEEQDDEDLEEGELGEPDEGDEEDTPEASGEPTQKRRVVYDRALLMDLKKTGSKDAAFISSIPPELRSDGKPMNHAGPGNQFGRMGNSPAFNRSNMGPPQGLRRDDRRDNKPGGPMNRMGMGQQWSMGGLGQPMAVPPMLRTVHAPKIMDLHRGEVGLHKAEKAWKPSVTVRHGRGGGAKDEEQKDEEELIIEDVVKKTRGILNKLTPENFEKLVQKFLQLNLEDKDERIGAVIHVVFEKAIDEPSFSTAYAKMVHTICQRSAETSKKFRKKILDQCQQEFQQGNTEEENIRDLETKLAEAEEDKKAQIQMELEEKKYGSRRRSLGNVRFIGELYKLQMLTPKIMVECVNMLLASHDEESYECLCKFLTTIGQKLDNNLREHEASNAQAIREKRTPKWVPETRFMENTFKKLKELSVDMSLSSRIRFALLDVYELRECDWKPRRDMNAPKTINEVRIAAAREEQEEKKQLMNLPPAQAPSRLPPSQQQNKKASDWNTVQSNKSSRFSNLSKKSNPAPEASGGLPIFAPSGGWGMRTGGGGMNSNQQSKPQLPPRFSRFSVLDQERTPAPPPLREEIVQPHPPSHRTSTSTSSHNSSRESSRPQTPTRDSQSYHSAGRQQSESPAEPPRDIKMDHTADAPETVKNIFQEFVSVRKWEDTVDWILSRFGGEKVIEFVDELSRQVCDMSKEEHQKTAGSLIKMLLKKDLTTKAQVIETLKNGVIVEMPDIEVDVPKVTSYLASFLVELFFDEEDLAWLVPLGEGIEDDFSSSWEDLVKHTLNILKLRRSEEAVQVLYRKTHKANRLPTQEMPWITGDTVESCANKMKAVLEKSDNVALLLSENSWDIREELTITSLIEAICRVSWKDGAWNSAVLEKLLPQIRLPSTKLYPPIWRQAKEFIKRNNIRKEDEEGLWQIMLKHNLISQDSPRAEV